MVIIGTFFSALMFVALYIAIAMALQGQETRRRRRHHVSKSGLRAPHKKTRIRTLADQSEEIDIISEGQAHHPNLHWQHPLTKYSHRPHFQRSY